MNEPLQLEAAGRLAQRMFTEGGKSAASRIEFAFELATGRKPGEPEVSAMETLLNQRKQAYEADPALATGVPAETNVPQAELAAYRDLASLILNLDETITRN
jgi:hypothetical protein